MWGVIRALQSSSAVYLGVDNLNVVRHVAKHIGWGAGWLCVDGGLLTLVEASVHQRGKDSVRISDVGGSRG